MKILIITSAYPNKKDLYSNAFVHSRVLKYKEIYKFQVEVIVCRRKIEEIEYEYEGVFVRQLTSDGLSKVLRNNIYDRIVIHFLTVPMMKALEKFEYKRDLLVWVHGEEALSWKSRLFNKNQKKFIKYVISNIFQLRSYRKFINKCSQVKFIFVSEWMKRQSEKDIGVKFKNYEILPNGIDTNYFRVDNRDNDKTSVLLIRPFTSKKYATDIATDAILKLSKLTNFNDFNIEIYGHGPMLETQTEKLRKFENIMIFDRFLNKQELKSVHQNNDIFLCPTRQDSQGVSMCEAMSSGLVPITSNSTAIPEFVQHNESGFLSNSAEEIVEYMLILNEDKSRMKHMSTNARNHMLNKCSEDKILKREIDIINN